MRTPEDPRPGRLEHLWGRRDLLTALGWGAIVSSLLASVVAFARLMVRRAPVLDPTIFSAGRPSDYAAGTVNDRFVKAWRVFVVRQNDRLFAVYAKCTHLGCTPRWYERETKFKCPCHGSGFTNAGVNFEGPAPKPLERARIWQDESGEVWIDVGRRFSQAEWGHAGAFVRVDGQRGGTA